MLSGIWDFLKDPDNRVVLGWIGGGIPVVAAGIWAVVKFMTKDGDQKPSKPSVSADHGSMAAGGDISIDARDRSNTPK